MGKIKAINYNLIKGENDNKNLVFIHGSGCNKKFLEPLAKELTEYNCYLIDLPGHGESDDTNCNCVEDYIEAVSEFIKELKNVTIIGHSLGGTICLGVSAKNIPSVVNSIVLNSSAKWDKFNKDFIEKALNGVVDKDYLLTTCGNLDNPLIFEALGTFEKDEILIKDLEICKTLNLENKLIEIKIPTLIITGQDEILGLVEYSEKLHKSISNSKLIIVPETKHMLPIAEKELIAKYIKNFII